MDKEKAIKILNSRRSGKEELREALAWALGIERQAVSGEQQAKTPSVFNACKSAFYAEYQKATSVPYTFGVKDGVALAGIIKKIEAHLTPNPSPGGEGGSVVATFTALVQHLPEWYKKNAFSLPVINSKFNEIVAAISKKNGAGSGNNATREAVRAAFSGNR